MLKNDVGGKESESEGPPRRPGRPQRLAPGQASNTTVLVGLDLLKAIAEIGRPVSLGELARTMRMSPSRTHRYVSSLCHAGFVRKATDTGHYDIGLATIALGRAAIGRVNNMRAAQDVMEVLTRETGLVSYLCVWGSNGPTVIRRELGSVQTAVRVSEGSTLSMMTATGQIFLAHLPHADTHEVLLRDIADWNATSMAEPVSFDEIQKAATRVRSAGLSRTTGMRNPTWTAFSTPVFNGGRFVMALTLIGVSRLFDNRLQGAVAIRLRAASIELTAMDISL